MPRGIPKSGVRKPMSAERRAQLRENILRIRARRHPPLSDQVYIDRLKSRCRIDESGCWLYEKGFVHPHGYGDMCYRNKNWAVHRLSYHLHKGPIPEGHDVCHTCDVRNCVNPNHLWTGPRIENNRDTRNKGRDNNSQKTHCPQGHAYAEHGYLLRHLGYKGWRGCRACGRIRQRIRAGWTKEQAESMPVTPRGRRPVKGKFPRRKRVSNV